MPQKDKKAKQSASKPVVKKADAKASAAKTKSLASAGGAVSSIKKMLGLGKPAKAPSKMVPVAKQTQPAIERQGAGRSATKDAVVAKSQLKTSPQKSSKASKSEMLAQTANKLSS